MVLSALKISDIGQDGSFRTVSYSSAIELHQLRNSSWVPGTLSWKQSIQSTVLCARLHLICIENQAVDILSAVPRTRWRFLNSSIGAFFNAGSLRRLLQTFDGSESDFDPKIQQEIRLENALLYHVLLVSVLLRVAEGWMCWNSSIPKWGPKRGRSWM